MTNPNDVSELFEKKDPIAEVPNKTIKATQEAPNHAFATAYGTDFVKASKDYWIIKDSEQLANYQTGYTLGQLGESKLNIQMMFSRLADAIEQICKYDLGKKNITSESLKDNFDSLKSIFKLLSRDIQKLNPDIRIQNHISMLKGYIDSFTENVVYRK